jgi:hypothetical protein
VGLPGWRWRSADRLDLRVMHGAACCGGGEHADIVAQGRHGM